MPWAPARPASPLWRPRWYAQTANHVSPIVLNAERIALDALKLDRSARFGAAGRVPRCPSARLDHQRGRERGRALFIAREPQARPPTQWLLLTVMTRGDGVSQRSVSWCPRPSMRPLAHRCWEEPAAVVAHERGLAVAAGPAAAPGQSKLEMGRAIWPKGAALLRRAAACTGRSARLHTPPEIRVWL